MFFYWGGEKLSFLRYMTIYSFCKLNPDWEAILYVPKNINNRITWNTGEQEGAYNGEDYFDKLKDLPVIIKELNDEFSIPDTHEVRKSDILRYYLIYNYGGMWSDMDIVYTKPMDLPLDSDIVCQHPVHNYYSIGLIGGNKGSTIYKYLIDSVSSVNGNGYQDYGNILWRSIDNSNTYNLPMSKVYAYDSTMIPKIYEDNKLPEDAIGCHWYAGNSLSKEWENKLNTETFINYNNLISNAIGETYDR
jgi:hypothetical protein